MRHFFSFKFQKIAESHRADLIEKFKSVEYLSATSDMWTRSNRSFLAISVHYYDPVTLEIKTSFIACEAFEGHHTNDKVAEKLRSIFNRYGILDKIFFITTDGGSEYVAALKNYGNNYRAIQSFNDESFTDWFDTHGNGDGDANANCDENNHSQSSIEEDIDMDCDTNLDEHSLIRVDTGSAPTDGDDDDRIRVLELFTADDILEEDMPMLRKMNRVSCSSHKLEKIGKFDALNAKNDPVFCQTYDRVFGQLEEIWSLRESRLKSEMFTRITGRKLIGPHRIRWMKTYDAVGCILIFYSHLNLKSVSNFNTRHFDSRQIK